MYNIYSTSFTCIHNEKNHLVCEKNRSSITCINVGCGLLTVSLYYSYKLCFSKKLFERYELKCQRRGKLDLRYEDKKKGAIQPCGRHVNMLTSISNLHSESILYSAIVGIYN